MKNLLQSHNKLLKTCHKMGFALTKLNNFAKFHKTQQQGKK